MFMIEGGEVGGVLSEKRIIKVFTAQLNHRGVNQVDRRTIYHVIYILSQIEHCSKAIKIEQHNKNIHVFFLLL